MGRTISVKGNPFNDGPHKLNEFWKRHEEKMIPQERAVIHTHINNFLATKVMGWEINDENPGAWYDPETEFFLYARGQSSKFSENWHPTYDLDQAMRCLNKINLAVDISFYPDGDLDYQWTVEFRCDHSIGTGPTLEVAIAGACANYKRWRFSES